MLHLDTIAPDTLSLLKRIQALPEFASTRLVGGTGLALQLGHRISVDLDVFCEWPREADLFSALKGVGNVRKSSYTRGSVPLGAPHLVYYRVKSRLNGQEILQMPDVVIDRGNWK